MRRSTARAWRLIALVGWFITPASLIAQTPSAGPQAGVQLLTIDAAMQYAVDHYPAVRAALEQINASTAAVSLARAAYLPSLDAMWQSNLATANNIFGQVLPQSILPAMSGPVLATASAQTAWGSATGALLTWQAVDFGVRNATVVGAEAAVTQARAGETLTRLDVQNAVGTAFLAVLAAQRAVAAAHADVDRRDTLVRVVHTLVDNQLRPGADASRVDAEHAAAQTRLIQAELLLTLARTTLARLLGATTDAVALDADNLLDRDPPVEDIPGPVTAHPLVQVRQAAVDVARAQQDVLVRTDRPRVYVLASLFARGSGAATSGPFDGGLNGLGLDRANWAAGIQVLFPNVFDFSALQARKAAAAAVERASTAQYDEALLTIASHQRAAAAMVQAARAVAATSPVQLAAARHSDAQATARYQAGLASIVEVADAQNLLAQAEVQEQLAHVDVWRALLAEAVAHGTLPAFLHLVRP